MPEPAAAAGDGSGSADRAPAAEEAVEEQEEGNGVRRSRRQPKRKVRISLYNGSFMHYLHHIVIVAIHH